MAAYAALVSVLNNIDQIKKHPTLSTCLDNQQIQPLVEKATFLLEFIETNNYGGRSNDKEAEAVERQIASAAHAVEDVIESHVVDQIHAGTNLRSSLDLQEIIEDLDAVMEKAAELKVKWGGSRKVEHATHTKAAAAALTETGESSSTRTRMVGLDEELNELLDQLTGNRYPSSRHVISVVGMGGMGKTTLANNVYQNSYIMQNFVIRAWATVSEQHDAHYMLSQLLSSLGKSTAGSVDGLGGQLHKTLLGRKYLIILDDAWSVGAWDSVRRFFPDNGNSSRVVLTTRMSNVAKDCGSSVFRMNLLDDDKSWNLFCEKVSIEHGDWPSPHLEEIGKEIVKLCKGLALSIVVIGGLLQRAPRSVGHWEGVVRDLNSIRNSKEKQDSLQLLSLTYTHLPPHLKPCFLYMGVFEEDSQIRVSKITKLWVGEGFIKPERGRVGEEIAEGYLHDLIERNLVLVGRLRKNGKIGSCGIHDLLRDLCIKLGEQQQFFHQVRYYGEEKGSTERRLIFHGSLREAKLPHPRSIMLWNYHDKPIVGRLVKVLDAYTCLYPTELYENVNLRYLAYEGRPSLWNLPSSVSLVWNLQSLIIEVSKYIVVVAPCEIWKMGQLRHVKCSQILLPDPPPSNDQELVLLNLQTLKVVLNLRLSEEVCRMFPNIKKLHLLYDPVLHGYDDSLMDESVCNLWRFHELESLFLSTKSSKWSTPDAKIDMKLIRFPSSLNMLSLSNCQFHCDDLTVIGSLPLLQVLMLGCLSVSEGLRWSPIEGQFQSLKFLKISWCSLFYWDADSSHFPVLEKLILCHLGYLKEIPVDIGEISTLKLILVEFCINSVAISAIRIREDHLETQGNDCSLQVQVKIKDIYLQSLKEQLETEELTLDNVDVMTSN